MPAAVLALALLPGGVWPHEVPALVVLVGTALLSWPSRSGAPVEVPRAVEAALVVALTGTVLAVSLSLPSGDEALGRDWYRYLGNAVAVGEGDWKLYHAWRAPLHAWLSAWLAPWFSGGLIPTTRAVSTVAITACLPLGWWLGRMLFGQWPALLGLALLAAWPDLALLAQLNTPYQLLAALFTLGAACTVAALTRRAWWSVPAGLAIGLAIATDLRGWALGAALGTGVVLAGLAQVGLRRRAAVVLLVGGGLAAGTGSALLAQLPVDLVPLSEQVALQRNLNASEGLQGCGGQVKNELHLVDFFTPCARQTLDYNVARAQRSVPVGLAFLGVLAALGFRARRDPTGWGPAFLLLPALTMVPSALIVGVQHRYALPFVPLLAMLGGAGLGRLADGVGGRPWVGRVAGLGLVAALAVGWWTWPGTILAHAQGRGTPSHIVRAGLGGAPRPPALLAATMRERMADGDTVVDCARLAMRQLLYPHPVEESYRKGRRGDLTTRCSSLLVKGPTGGGTTWLVLPGGVREQPAENWRQVLRVGDGIVLLEGRR